MASSMQEPPASCRERLATTVGAHYALVEHIEELLLPGGEAIAWADSTHLGDEQGNIHFSVLRNAMHWLLQGASQDVDP